MRNQEVSETTLATPRYSALALDLDKVGCLLEDHEMRLLPRKRNNPKLSDVCQDSWPSLHPYMITMKKHQIFISAGQSQVYLECGKEYYREQSYMELEEHA